MISILKNYRFRNSKSIHQRNALNLVLFYYILQHNILFTIKQLRLFYLCFINNKIKTVKLFDKILYSTLFFYKFIECKRHAKNLNFKSIYLLILLNVVIN
jgi:hypothetical protein